MCIRDRAIAQRLEVAKLLKEQNVYSKIVEKTGASTATISRAVSYTHLGVLSAPGQRRQQHQGAQ